MYKNLITLVMASTVTLALSGCALSIGNHNVHNGESASSTFGNINVDDGEHAGQLEAINGNIEIGANAKVDAVDVVNGNIEIEHSTQVESLETVNGNIEADREVVISGNVKTVNGNIEFEKNARLGGDVETVNGNIVLASGSVVAGDIIFNHSGSWFSGMISKVPKLELGEEVIIGGQIHLYRAVDLILPDSVSSTKIKRHYRDEQ